jgi:hypothetical protein
MRFAMKLFPSSLFASSTWRRGAVLAALLGAVVAGFGAVAFAAGEGCGKTSELKTPELKPVENKASDYPTTAVADYVFACMVANGESRDSLFHCSCSFDRMAEILPYSKYEQAETILSVSQQGGDTTSMFRSNPQLKEIVAEMRRAQAEAEVRCF